MRSCCWCAAADVLMLLMRWCCWCTDAADVLMLLMRWCWSLHVHVSDALMHWWCWCTCADDALLLLMLIMLLMRWFCLCADAGYALMLLMRWCVDVADALMLLMFMILLMHWFCLCADAAYMLIRLMRWCVDVADALMLQICWCTNATESWSGSARGPFYSVLVSKFKIFFGPKTNIFKEQIFLGQIFSKNKYFLVPRQFQFHNFYFQINNNIWEQWLNSINRIFGCRGVGHNTSVIVFGTDHICIW